MATQTCKNCRKAGEKLFLKGDRCLSPNCGVTRRVSATPSRSTGKRRNKKSEYGLQLAEKQKARAEYGIRERQFRTYFEKAARSQTATGEALLSNLELRLDNVIYRLGWARSRAQARQIINHGHIKVNNKMVDIPSYQVKMKDSLEPIMLDLIKNIAMEKPSVPSWLKAEKNFKAQITALPLKDEIDTPIDEQLIVEFYSR